MRLSKGNPHPLPLPFRGKRMGTRRTIVAKIDTPHGLGYGQEITGIAVVRITGGPSVARYDYIEFGLRLGEVRVFLTHGYWAQLWAGEDVCGYYGPYDSRAEALIIGAGYALLAGARGVDVVDDFPDELVIRG